MLLETDGWRPYPAAAERSLHGFGFLSRDMLASICRDVRRIVTVVVVMLVLTLTATLLVHPYYVAEATLLVLPQDSARPGATDHESLLKSELEIIASRSLLVAAMDRIGARSLYPALYAQDEAGAHALAANQFVQDFHAAADGPGAVLKLGFRGRDPVSAARALNTIIAVYLEKRAVLFRSVPPDSLPGQGEDVRRRLDRADADLAAFKTQAGIVDYDFQRGMLLRQRDDLARDLQKADIEAAAATQSRNAAAAQLAGTPKTVVISDERDTRRAADAPRANAGSVQRRGRSEIYDSLALDRARSAIALEAAHARHDTDVQQIAAVQLELARLQGSDAALQRASHARDLLAQEYQAVLQNRAAERLAEGADADRASNVRIIQAAEPPDQSTHPRLIVLLVGMALSFFIGGAVALMGNWFRRGYISPETLERRLGVPVLASIPDLTRLDRSYDRLSDYGPAE